MTKLPERNVLDGSKNPQTSTGELKEALTAIRDYLSELFGDDSTDKEAVRQKLGINTEEAGKGSVPVGTVAYFAMATPPAGYLKADGSAVGRETYPDLFGAIGTTYGSGDGIVTFNLPNLMGRFAEGSTTPGTAKAAGLPNVTGLHSVAVWAYESLNPSGCFCKGNVYSQKIEGGTGTYQNLPNLVFDASRSNPVYGASTTVQPPALTLLPCIKAFDA